MSVLNWYWNTCNIGYSVHNEYAIALVILVAYVHTVDTEHWNTHKYSIASMTSKQDHLAGCLSGASIKPLHLTMRFWMGPLLLLSQSQSPLILVQKSQKTSTFYHHYKECQILINSLYSLYLKAWLAIAVVIVFDSQCFKAIWVAESKSVLYTDHVLYLWDLKKFENLFISK